MINGSPRANGNTSIALNEMKTVFEKEGVDAEIVQVGSEAVRGCIACNRCAELGKCVFDDVVNKLEPTMAFRYKFFVSEDGKMWKEVPTNGEFSNIMHNPLPQTVTLGQKIQARFIKLEATTPTATTAKIEMNEIGVMVTP